MRRVVYICEPSFVRRVSEADIRLQRRNGRSEKKKSHKKKIVLRASQFTMKISFKKYIFAQTERPASGWLHYNIFIYIFLFFCCGALARSSSSDANDVAVCMCGFFSRRI